MLNIQIFCRNERFRSFYYVHVTRKSCQNNVQRARFTLMKLKAGRAGRRGKIRSRFGQDVTTSMNKFFSLKFFFHPLALFSHRKMKLIRFYYGLMFKCFFYVDSILLHFLRSVLAN